MRLTPESSERQRASVGGVIYASHKTWMLGLGDVGFIFIAGHGARDAAAAAKRLEELPTLRISDDFKRRMRDGS